jgi:hypothetical protein
MKLRIKYQSLRIKSENKQSFCPKKVETLTHGLSNARKQDQNWEWPIFKSMRLNRLPIVSNKLKLHRLMSSSPPKKTWQYSSRPKTGCSRTKTLRSRWSKLHYKRKKMRLFPSKKVKILIEPSMMINCLGRWKRPTNWGPSSKIERQDWSNEKMNWHIWINKTATWLTKLTSLKTRWRRKIKF